MKKRYFIAIILTGIILALTNSMWLCKRPVDVTFNLDGNQEVKIDVSLGSSKHQEQKIDLTEKNELKFEVPKKGSFKILKISINSELQPKWGALSDVKLKRGRLKADDLSKFTVTGAKYKIKDNKLVLTPTDNEIVLYYPISGSPSTTFQFDVFLSILILSILCSLKLSNYLADFKTLKNASRIDITFLTIFFVILFIPMSHINLDEISRTENRTLAKMPLFTKIDGRINYKYGKEYEEYFNDRFTLRNEIISLNHFLVYNLQKYLK